MEILKWFLPTAGNKIYKLPIDRKNTWILFLFDVGKKIIPRSSKIDITKSAKLLSIKSYVSFNEVPKTLIIIPAEKKEPYVNTANREVATKRANAICKILYFCK